LATAATATQASVALVLFADVNAHNPLLEAAASQRVALTGSLDFANERFNDVTVAVVDGKGCPKVRQRIRGPFGKPVVENASVLQSAAGPLLNLFKQAGKLFGGPCEVFYAGSVAPPE
jgi:hypothetical protein